jgi:glycine dehydrogenase subunit 1
MQPQRFRDYSAHTQEQRQQMLEQMELSSTDELFNVIPREIKLKRKLNLPPAQDEWQLLRHVELLANKNFTTKTHLSFLGGGVYEHFIPAVVDAIVERGELKTSYTPYQPKISQGLLQILYEYQIYMAAITGCQVVNASAYDGATALAEAAFMAIRSKKEKTRHCLVIDCALWPEYQSVVRTYFSGQPVDTEFFISNNSDGQIDLVRLQNIFQRLKPDAFLFQSPNAFGILENVASISQICKAHDVVSIISYNPVVSGILKPPGELGIDIVTGSGQMLGIPLRAGGSSLGFLATSLAFKPYIPGRIVGQNKDGFCLILEEREQHVAREKATSNICSNQALNAMRAAVFLGYMGDLGLSSMATLSANKARYLCDGLSKIPNVSLAKNGVFFNEFCLLSPKPIALWQEALLSKGIFAGIDVSNICMRPAMLIAVTEVKSKADLDRMIEASREVLLS